MNKQSETPSLPTKEVVFTTPCTFKGVEYEKGGKAQATDAQTKALKEAGLI